jgi:hypothetical protein
MKSELDVYSYFASFQVRSAGIMGDDVLYTDTTNEQRTPRRQARVLGLSLLDALERSKPSPLRVDL